MLDKNEVIFVELMNEYLPSTPTNTGNSLKDIRCISYALESLVNLLKKADNMKDIDGYCMAAMLALIFGRLHEVALQLEQEIEGNNNVRTNEAPGPTAAI